MSSGSAAGAVLVTRVGAAVGSKELAAALACAGSDPDRAGLLVELREEEVPVRPGLVATAAARGLEERLRAHLPGAAVSARGCCCRMVVSQDEEGLELVRAAQPTVREATCVVHVPPGLADEALGLERLGLSSAVLRADLAEDRALTALAVRGLMAVGLRVTVAKRPLPWALARMASVGALPGRALRGAARRDLDRCL